MFSLLSSSVEEWSADGGVVAARAQRSRCDCSPLDHANSHHEFYGRFNNGILYRGHNFYGCLYDSNAANHNLGRNDYGLNYNNFSGYIA